MAFAGFGQIDSVVAALAKTGISTASSAITDNPALQNIMSQTGTVIATETGILSPSALMAAPAAMALAAWIGGFIESLSWRPSPVDDPVYNKIYHDGMNRVAKMKSWGLTPQEMEELAWKAGMIPLEYNSFIGALGSSDPQVLADNLIVLELQHITTSDFGINGIYLPIEKAYINAAASNYFGYTVDPNAGWGRMPEWNQFTSTLQFPPMIPFDIHLPLSDSIVQKMKAAGVDIVPVSPTGTTPGTVIPGIPTTPTVTPPGTYNPNTGQTTVPTQYTTPTPSTLLAGLPTWAIIAFAGLGILFIFRK